jgi:tetratricopeptide (TPR) repeat protein
MEQEGTSHQLTA